MEQKLDKNDSKMSFIETVAQIRRPILIEKVYHEINDEFIGSCPDKNTRDDIQIKLLYSLPFLEETICDERNNPASMIDRGLVAVKCMWDIKNGSYKYVDLIFGNLK